MVLGVPEIDIPPDAGKIEWIQSLLSNNWQPFYFGCFITGLFFAIVSSLGLNEFWKWRVLRRRKRRLLRTDHSARLAQDNIEYEKKIK